MSSADDHVVELASVAPAPAPAAANGKKEKPPPVPMASLRELFQFATPLDMLLMLVGWSSALACGACVVLLLIPFADMMDLAGGLATGLSIDFQLMLEVSLWLVWFGLAAFVSGWAYGWCFDLAKERQVILLKKAYLKAIIRQDVGWYDTSNPQELPSKIGECVALIDEGLGSRAWQVFEYIGMGIAGIICSLFYAWDICLVMLIASPLIIASSALMASVQKGSIAKITAAYAASGGIATEMLASIRTVASLALEEKASERYESHLGLAASAYIRKSYLEGFANSMLLAVGSIMMAIGMLYAGAMRYLETSRTSLLWSFNVTYPGPVEQELTLCIDGCDPYNPAALLEGGYPTTPAACVAAGRSPLHMTCGTAAYYANGTDFLFGRGVAWPGGGVATDSSSTLLQALTSLLPSLSDFVTYFTADRSYYPCHRTASGALLGIFGLVQGMQGAGFIGTGISAVTKARQAMYTVNRTLSRVPTIDSFVDKGQRPASVRGDVVVSEVVFAYPSAPSHLVCKGYSLHIPAGQVVALCGPSGSGKSTVIQLIERFYDPQSGSVSLDGVDLRELNVRWLRQQIALVGQEPVLFVGSVADNIAYGKEGATQAEVEEAAKMANAHGFITENLGDGYSTEVGQGGGKLSGGQKQRVAIARALVRQPSVLLLDEATSALDTQSERVVQAALDEIMAKQKRTTVVVAHRLSTIRHADKIAVVNEGRIVEEGSHDSLMELGLREGSVYASLVGAQAL